MRSSLFGGKAFDEYAKWRHTGVRLNRIINMLEMFLTLGLADFIDQKELMSHCAQDGPGFVVKGFHICQDWEIVLAKNGDPRIPL
jgi:hypothetical protein